MTDQELEEMQDLEERLSYSEYKRGKTADLVLRQSKELKRHREAVDIYKGFISSFIDATAYYSESDTIHVYDLTTDGKEALKEGELILNPQKETTT